MLRANVWPIPTPKGSESSVANVATRRLRRTSGRIEVSVDGSDWTAIADTEGTTTHGGDLRS